MPLLYQLYSPLHTAPPGPPQSFIITPEDSTTLIFTWDPPNLENGIPDEYVLTCVAEMEGFPMPLGFPRIVQAGDPPEAITTSLSGFSPAVMYNCSVYSSNGAGDGDPVCDSATTLEAGALLALFPPPHLLTIFWC